MAKIKCFVLVNCLLCVLCHSILPVNAMNGPDVFHNEQNTVKDGWSSDGQMYYQNGKYVTGPKTIDGFNYYFDEKTGKMVHGWKTVTVNGKKQTYWYGQETGHMLYGDQRINGIWYHFDEKTGALTEENTSGSEGWSADGDKYYVGNSYVTGEYVIAGKSYYFDPATGVVYKNRWRKSDNSYVYYGSDGARAAGEQTINGYQYYFNTATGLMKKGWRAKNGSYVYYDGSGHMVFGERKISDFVYYFDDNTGLMVKGWHEAAGARYYYDTLGHMVFGEQIIEGESYYFDEVTGALVQDEPAVKNGWDTQEGRYYVNDDYVTGEYSIDGDNYYFDETTGIVWKNRWKKKENSYVYYGETGAQVSGDQTIRGYKYHFDETTRLMKKGWYEVNGSRYYFDNQGHMLYGQQTIDGATYYFDETTGAMKENLTNQKDGWSKDSDRYYLGGKFVTGEYTIDNKVYYFDPSTGLMYRSRWRKTDGSYVFYGKDGVRFSGERTIGGFQYYFSESTGLMKKGWRKKDNSYVFYDASGHMVHGEAMIGGYNYYFDEVTGLMKKGWRKKGSSYVYYDASGHMLYGEQTIGGEDYYFDQTSGLMKKGWMEKDNSYVYYNASGHMIHGEQMIGGYNYYFSLVDGRMYKGWRIVSGKKYYYQEDGHMAKGQKQLNGSWYYFDKTGVMAVGRTSIPADENSGSAKVIVADTDGKYILHNAKVGLMYYSISSATDAVNVGRVESEKKIYMEGIDVSQWNGNFDFSSYKNQFVIIRASWGQTHKDTKVDQFVAECERLGIPYGFYTYSYAENNAEAKEEAQFCLSIINDLKNKHGGKLNYFCMGVWFDMEDADHWKARRGFKFTNANIGGLCYTFCNEISKKGYYTGIYMSASWLKYLSGTNANQYDKWVAHWGTKNATGEMTIETSSYGTMQQYTSSNGKLDKDVIFVDKNHYKNR